jgi:hypothetical protein
MVLWLLAAIALSLLIGAYGRDRKMGFWGYFFASLLLTPAVGLLLVLGSDRRTAPGANPANSEVADSTPPKP